MNNEELYQYIISHTGKQNCLFSNFDRTLDLGEGFYAITKNGKWGCIAFDGTFIAPVLYDFVYLDEFQYGCFCLVCGHNGYFSRDIDGCVKYHGLYDIYVGDRLLLCNLNNYENINHPTCFLTQFD